MGQLQRTNVFALICYLISPFFPFPLLSFFSHRPHWMRECHFSCIQMHKRYFFPFIFQIRFDCISFSLSPHFFFSLSPLPVLPCFRYSFFFQFVSIRRFTLFPHLSFPCVSSPQTRSPTTRTSMCRSVCTPSASSATSMSSRQRSTAKCVRLSASCIRSETAQHR